MLVDQSHPDRTESTNFFCKDPDDKYFRLWDHIASFTSTQLHHFNNKADTDNTQMNRAAAVL